MSAAKKKLTAAEALVADGGVDVGGLVIRPVVEESRVLVAVGDEQRELGREQVFELQRELRSATGLDVAVGPETAALGQEQALELQRHLTSAAAAAF